MTLWDWLWRTDVEVVGKNAAMKRMLEAFEKEKADDEAARVQAGDARLYATTL